MSAPVIAAIDLGPLTGRVLFHAAAFARLLQVPLRVLHVNGEATPSLRERVLNACLQLGPYQTDFDDSQIVIRLVPALSTPRSEPSWHISQSICSTTA